MPNHKATINRLEQLIERLQDNVTFEELHLQALDQFSPRAKVRCGLAEEQCGSWCRLAAAFMGLDVIPKSYFV